MKQEIKKYKRHHEELKSALDLFKKYKTYASIQSEINMIREAAHNTIGHLKDILYKKNKIVERYKKKLI